MQQRRSRAARRPNTGEQAKDDKLLAEPVEGPKSQVAKLDHRRIHTDSAVESSNHAERARLPHEQQEAQVDVELDPAVFSLFEPELQGGHQRRVDERAGKFRQGHPNEPQPIHAADRQDSSSTEEPVGQEVTAQNEGVE